MQEQNRIAIGDYRSGKAYTRKKFVNVRYSIQILTIDCKWHDEEDDFFCVSCAWFLRRKTAAVLAYDMILLWGLI
jgi:hypothetical protein